MSKIITLRKGLDINLQGKAVEKLVKLPLAPEYAVSPLDFEGVTPKLLVKAGDRVKAGTPLFFNKYNERVVFTSPVSGTVSAINRGEKRCILNVTVQADATQMYEEFAKLNVQTASREEIIDLLLKSGLWPMIIQRPYGIIADPSDTPKAVFVSTFDSAPLAPDYNFVLAGEKRNLETGIEAMRKLTSGKVHLGVRAGAEGEMASLKGAEIHTFAGKHPVGNVGVQIHHVDPINKDERVWTVNIQDLAIIGRLLNEGRVDRTKVIAVAGSEVKNPQYYRLIDGAPVASVLKDNLKPSAHNPRIISGNVLTGRKTPADGFIGFYANMVTVIPEGNHYELLGWAMPRLNKFSVSRAYFSWLCPKKVYDLDTNLNGGERPFVVTGLYDKYLPMDIYPTYLLKAILAGDIDKMVEEYRQALLIRQLDQHYVDRSIDTVFTADEIAAYYNAHKADFKLDRTIVKGRIVRFGEGYRQAAKLKTLMGARSEAQQQDFRDICEKNDFTVDDFRDQWIDFPEFLSYLPTLRSQSYDSVLATAAVQEMRDSHAHYYFQIDAVLREGEPIPLERLRGTIRRILFNQRKGEIIRAHEEELCARASEMGEVKIFADEKPKKDE